MKDEKYQQLHQLAKVLNKQPVEIAAPESQVSLNGRGKFERRNKFIVIQNRKGHHRKNNLTYLLRTNNNVMIRVDLHGKTHNRVPTPHVHIFDETHGNGTVAIPLINLSKYSALSDDIVESLKAFLKYNNFETEELTFTNNLV